MGISPQAEAMTEETMDEVEDHRLKRAAEAGSRLSRQRAAAPQGPVAHRVGPGVLDAEPGNAGEAEAKGLVAGVVGAHRRQ